MRALDFPLLADQNIHRDVVAALRLQGREVATVEEQGLAEADDTAILARAVAEGRVVLTHDGDFGTLAIVAGAPVVGIVYLRPGHIDPAYVSAMLHALALADVDLDPPFIAVVQRRDSDVRIRFRPVPVATPPSQAGGRGSPESG